MFTERYRNLSPYVPGEQPGEKKYIKLNTNENPYPPSPEVEKFLKAADPARLRLYPDPAMTNLRRSLSKETGVKPESIFLGNGSDEVLSFCFYAFFESSRGPLLFPEHTYSFYPVYCSYYSIDYEKVPLRDDFSICLTDYPKRESFTGIIFANPNAPTGMYKTIPEIEELMNSVPEDRVVIVDEAYIDFGGESVVPLTERYGNLLVVRTFSKSRSLAGARIGFAVGNPVLINALYAVKDSFNSYPLDYISQEIARVSLEDTEYFRKTVSRIMKTRSSVTKTLEETGWQVLPSKANFIFARKEGVSGEEVYSYLKERGVLVRYFPHRGIEDFVRITIGRDDEMMTLLKLLENF